MSRFLYFAYGSNMLSARLRERTPSAIPVGVGQLPGHGLRWHKAGSDGSGKCDIVEVADPRSIVHGVLYEIVVGEKPRLDVAESLGVGYAEKRATVHLGSQPLAATLYVALQIDPASLPYDWYLALVVAGAREHALGADYLAQLEAVASRQDPDADRARRHFALIGRDPLPVRPLGYA